MVTSSEKPLNKGGFLASVTVARIALIAVVAVAVLAFAGLIWRVADLLILIFGGIVLAAVLRAIAQPIQDYARLPPGIAFALAVALVPLVLIALFWLVGDQALGQMGRLFSQLPDAWSKTQAWLEQQRFGGVLLDGLRGLASGTSGSRMAGYAATAFGGLADALVILVLAVFLGANPGLYRRGVLCLVPRLAHDRVADALDASGEALKGWLIGKAAAMLAVGILTGLGLWLLGVPMALGLGFLTGLLDFVPLLGPLIAAIPAVLVAFTQSPTLALYTLVLFLVIQNVEGYAIEPITQKWAVALPPALTVIGVLLFGLLFGIVGVIFATPLMVVSMVLVRKLYVQWALGRA